MVGLTAEANSIESSQMSSQSSPCTCKSDLPKVLQTPAPYTHALNAAQNSYGETPNATRPTVTKSKDGSAGTADCVLVIQWASKTLGATKRRSSNLTNPMN